MLDSLRIPRGAEGLAPGEGVGRGASSQRAVASGQVTLLLLCEDLLRLTLPPQLTLPGGRAQKLPKQRPGDPHPKLNLLILLKKKKKSKQYLLHVRDY